MIWHVLACHEIVEARVEVQALDHKLVLSLRSELKNSFSSMISKDNQREILVLLTGIIRWFQILCIKVPLLL